MRIATVLLGLSLATPAMAQQTDNTQILQQQRDVSLSGQVSQAFGAANRAGDPISSRVNGFPEPSRWGVCVATAAPADARAYVTRRDRAELASVRDRLVPVFATCGNYDGALSGRTRRGAIRDALRFTSPR